MKTNIKFRPNFNLDYTTRIAYNSYGYSAVRTAAENGLTYSSGSGDYHLQNDRNTLINQSRDFMRNNSIYKGMIERAVSYIVGTGFGLQVRTGDKDTDTLIEKAWKDYWKRPEIRGMLSGRKVEKMICRELLVCGDVGVVKIDGGKIQLVESEQITGYGTNSRIIDGIDVDQYGRPVGYKVYPYGRGYLNKSKGQTYTPENFLFIADPDRPSLTRGVPPLQSAFPNFHRLDDVCNSEAVAWQLLSKIAVAVTREKGAEQGFLESTDDTNQTAAEKDSSLADRVTDIGVGLIFHGEPGDEVKGIDRNIPGSNFENSVRIFLRLIGLPLGLPLEITLLDWTKSNYSQSRAVLEQAYQTFIGFQEIIEDCFLRPLFDWRLPEILRVINRQQAKVEHDWIKPTFPWIDQLKEAQANEEMVLTGITTHGEVCKSRNRDRNDINDERQKEITDAIERAKQVKSDTGTDIPWEYFAGMKPTAPTKPAQPEEPQEPEQDDKQDDEEKTDDSSK